MDLGQQAKITLQNFVPQIRGRIETALDQELRLDFGFSPRQKQVVNDALVHAKEFVLRPQKHLRSSFVMHGYMLEGKDPSEQVWKAATAVELVHGALLMHDDFMDRDEVRRGGPTTHKYYQDKFSGDLHLGQSMAIDIGDELLCIGFELLADCNDSMAMKKMLRGITNTAHGQAYDVTLEAFRNWTEEDVLVLHQAKTAIYTYENPLFIGAHLAKLPQEAFDILHDYSMDGGVAFQLQDDILGVFGTPDKTGKSADSDLKQGKCTLLVLKAFESSKHKNTVEKVWGDMNATRADLDLAKQAIIDSGSLEYSKSLSRKLARNAATTASKLRDLKLNAPAIDFIQGVAEYMVDREI